MIRARNIAIVLLLAAARVAPGAAQPPREPQAAQAVTEDPRLEAQAREIASTLRCPTCRALSVQDSPSGMALEMRELIREQLRAGKTPEEITAYFVDRYGEWILLKPTAEGFNWTVWVLPVLMIVGGLIFVFLTARRWVAHGQARAQALSEAADPAVGVREPASSLASARLEKEESER